MFTVCPIILCVCFQNWRNHTALTVACRNGHRATVNVLLDHGAVIDYQNEVVCASDDVLNKL